MSRKRKNTDNEINNDINNNKKKGKSSDTIGHNSVEYYIKGEYLDTLDSKIIRSFNHVYFYSPITRKSSAELISLLLSIDHNNIEDMHKNGNDSAKMRPINLHILSEGGDIFASLAIYQNIKRLQSPIHCYVDGFLSSAAIIVLLACEERYMNKNTFLGIHSIKMSVWGKLQFLQQCNNKYQQIWDSLERMYDENTKLRKNKKDIKKFMSEPQLMDSKTALKYGFITKLI